MAYDCQFRNSELNNRSATGESKNPGAPSKLNAPCKPAGQSLVESFLPGNLPAWQGTFNKQNVNHSTPDCARRGKNQSFFVPFRRRTRTRQDFSAQLSSEVEGKQWQKNQLESCASKRSAELWTPERSEERINKQFHYSGRNVGHIFSMLNFSRNFHVFPEIDSFLSICPPIEFTFLKFQCPSLKECTLRVRGSKRFGQISGPMFAGSLDCLYYVSAPDIDMLGNVYCYSMLPFQ